MARPEKPVVGRKKGQADLFLFDPETGHRGPVELKRRRKDNGMDVLRKEQLENAPAYEEVYGTPPRVMRFLEYDGERADGDDHPFMFLTYVQDAGLHLYLHGSCQGGFREDRSRHRSWKQGVP